MLAICSDIHANSEALRAVLEDMKKRGATEVICLGDVVGYGPSPADCLRIAQERFQVTLLGNHECAILTEPLGFHRVARDAARWHKQSLFPHWWSSKEKKDAWDFLASLRDHYRMGKLLFVHASPSNFTEEYLLRTDIDEILHELGPKLTRAFEKTEWVTFVGHTHYPGVFTDDAYFFTPKDLNGRLELKDDRKYIINVGSVGQPRDNDNRACYATLDRGIVEYHRVEYDVQATYKKVIESGVLDRSLAERLLSGT